MEADFLKRYADETKQAMWSKARMDATRNAALVILFLMIAAAFGFDEATAHRVPYFGSLAVFALVIFEARLFRLGAMDRQRVMWLERNFLPSLFNQQHTHSYSKSEQQQNNVPATQTPTFLEAIAYRIYKNYFLLFLALDISWLTKIYLSPMPALSFTEMVHRLDLGFFSGWITVGFMVLFWAGFIAAIIYVRKAKKQKSYLNGY